MAANVPWPQPLFRSGLPSVPDLPARNASTGDLCLYRTQVSGRVQPGVRVGTGWKGYTIVGAADVTGDGIGDLIARDSGGELWRQDGNGTGGFKPRPLVFRERGAGRDAIVAAGDVTGDPGTARRSPTARGITRTGRESPVARGGCVPGGRAGTGP